MEELRVQGEIAALPNLMTSLGQIGTAQSQLAQEGLSKAIRKCFTCLGYLGKACASYQAY